MPEEIITRDSAAFKELYRDIVKAIRAVDILYISTTRRAVEPTCCSALWTVCAIKPATNI